jgi:hypothetical protein
MKWSMANSRVALLAKLREAGAGQVSSLNRKSIFA